jgi:hypothetical protein
MQTTRDITQHLHAITGGATPPGDLVVHTRLLEHARFTQARCNANGVLNPAGHNLKTVPRPL